MITKGKENFGHLQLHGLRVYPYALFPIIIIEIDEHTCMITNNKTLEIPQYSYLQLINWIINFISKFNKFAYL